MSSFNERDNYRVGGNPLNRDDMKEINEQDSHCVLSFDSDKSEINKRADDVVVFIESNDVVNHCAAPVDSDCEQKLGLCCIYRQRG